MRFVIVGAGRVGRRTARVLATEGHDVELVDVDHSRVEELRQEGYSVIEGDGAVEETLIGVGLTDVDGLAAVTGDTMTNLIACMIAKAHNCRTVLRVRTDYQEYVLRKYASDIDEVLYPERLGAIAAKNALMGGDIRAIADIAQDVQLVEFTVTESSPMRGYTLSELELPGGCRLLGYGKAGEPVGLPEEDLSLELGDRLIVIAEFGRLADVRQLIVGDGQTAATA
jgi:trk system potassium uptake protein TrkA